MSDAEEIHHRGIAAFQAGQIDEAIDLLGQAIATGNADAEIYANLGVINREAGNLQVAREHLEEAVERASNNADFYYNLALVYGDLEELDLAQKHYELALSMRPGMAPALNNLGNIKKAQKDTDGAVAFYQQAIEADEGYAPAHRNLADAFESAGFVSAAHDSYTTAIQLRQDTGTRIRDALVLPVIPDSNDQIEESRARLNGKLDDLLNDELSLEDPLREVGATNFLLACHGLNDKPIQEKIAQTYLKACPALAFEASHAKDWMAGLEGGVPRIGFVSSFFHEHTIAKLNNSLITGLPKARFDVKVFSFSDVEDSWSEKFKKLGANFVRLPMDLENARRVIAEAELDILYYTDIGMEPMTYFLSFARLAPVQCVSVGHPVTTGIPNIDYFISADLIETSNSAEAYSEKLVRLDGFPTCVARPEEFKDLAPRKKSSGQRIVCPQSLFKFHPDFDDMLGDILRVLPDATIQLIDGSHPAWTELLQKRLLKSLSDVSDRIEILPRLNSEAFAALLNVADVILDTPHFSGGMTTYQALAAVTPVVTLPGDFMRGRYSLGLYRQMQMTDCVADSAEEYVEITKRLCTDSSFAESTRDQIKAGHELIFDNRKAIDRHAKFFEKVMFEG
ncbi:MAG: tetratricopeptide repeat protein [Rhodospirillales bacterium]|jgi:predicted O-linked N-acetylglucosamine transferase (SPINDLY family)